MAKVKSNVHVGNNIYLLGIEHPGHCLMGQFFMLRCWELDPLLSRPISVFDHREGELQFLYQVLGKGTRKLSRLREGEDLTLYGPYGNGFPYLESEKVTLVGGGMGIAPLFYAGRELTRINPEREIKIYLGLREKNPVIETFKAAFSKVTVNIGGKITDDVTYEDDTVIFTCGPEVMMKTLCIEGAQKSIDVYASVEKKMACGVGACLSCTCKTKWGNKKTCKDGPVFLGEEMVYE